MTAIDGKQLNPCWSLLQLIQSDAKKLEMTEYLVHGYSSESTQRELSNEYQQDRVKIFQKYLHPCVLGQSNINIGRVKLQAYLIPGPFMKIE